MANLVPVVVDPSLDLRNLVGCDFVAVPDYDVEDEVVVDVAVNHDLDCDPSNLANHPTLETQPTHLALVHCCCNHGKTLIWTARFVNIFRAVFRIYFDPGQRVSEDHANLHIPPPFFQKKSH